MRLKPFCWQLILLLILAACNSKKDRTVKRDVLIENVATTINPGTDIFLYANAGWIKNNPFPADQSGWGIGHLVVEENLKRLREIAETAAKSNAAKRNFWAMAMDTIKIEADGLKPLQPLLEKGNKISDAKTMLATVAEFKKSGSSTLFSDGVTQDDKNSEVITYKLSQGGLGLPDREYYLKSDSTTKNIREKYLAYISKILRMAGDDSVATLTAAKNILALETKLAQASRRLEDLRDPYANYNKMAPGIGLQEYLTMIGVKGLDFVIVGQPEFFIALDKAKKRYEDMVEAVRDALKNRISKLQWMGDSSKQKAYIKLASLWIEMSGICFHKPTMHITIHPIMRLCCRQELLQCRA